MTNSLVFRTEWIKQTLGWIVCLGSAGILAASIGATVKYWDTQTSADLWSGVIMGLFLVAFMFIGVAIQYTRWSIADDTILFHTIIGTRKFPVAELAGFGKLTIMVSLFPLVHVDLFDRDLKHVVRLPVRIKDWPVAEAWFAPRLRYVVNQGSAALPKRRFVASRNV